MGLRRGHGDIISLRAVCLPLRNNLQVSKRRFMSSQATFQRIRNHGKGFCIARSCSYRCVVLCSPYNVVLLPTVNGRSHAHRCRPVGTSVVRRSRTSAFLPDERRGRRCLWSIAPKIVECSTSYRELHTVELYVVSRVVCQ